MGQNYNGYSQGPYNGPLPPANTPVLPNGYNPPQYTPAGNGNPLNGDNEPGVVSSPGNVGVTRVNGAASAMQDLTADLQYYVCFASSPLCFTDPNPNPPDSEDITRLVNIQVTGSPLDLSQKNFEVFIMSIAMRAMPVILQNPIPVMELAVYTNELSGQGFVWKFAVERGVQFYNFTPFGTPGPVGLLVDDLDGLILPSGVRVTTVTGSPSGWAQNVSFNRLDAI